MTFSKAVTVWCEDCVEFIEIQEATKKRANEQARKRGWAVREWNRHYCPNCK